MLEHGRRSIPALVLGFLVCLFYSVIFAGQVLGLLGLYNIWLAVPLALVVFALSAYFYFKSLPISGPQDGAAAASFSQLDILFGACALLLTALLVAVPLLLWPASTAGKALTWDAGLFHFPKAVELFRSGSMWDMNVCYAEYPLGYESLLSFVLLLTGNAAFFGYVHLLLALFLIASLWLLAQRYTRLPVGMLLLGIVLILLSGFLEKDLNPWWVYYPLIFTVGKNDLFQGAAVLAALAYAPIAATRDEKPAWNRVGFALASMIAFSIKPNSLIILPLWLLAFYYLWKDSPARSDFFKKGLLMLAVALPGLLWVFRNLVALQALFTPTSLKLTGWSIAANLTNPNLYNYIPKYLYFFLALTALVVGLAILRRRISFAAAAALAILLLGFAVTPASGFLGSTANHAEIAWRFAVAFISYALLLLLVLAGPMIQKLVEAAGRYRVAALLLAVGALACSGFYFWQMRQLVRHVSGNAFILHDQFEQPVGTGGYYSAYDYARRSILGRTPQTIIVDNGLPFYAYGSGFSNATACSGPADYFIVFNTDWDSGQPGEYPEYVGTASWAGDWNVAYEDRYSRVYRRR
jgi:hypothetical protein